MTAKLIFRIHEKGCSQDEQQAAQKRYVITNPPPHFNLFSSDRVGLNILDLFHLILIWFRCLCWCSLIREWCTRGAGKRVMNRSVVYYIPDHPLFYQQTFNKPYKLTTGGVINSHILNVQGARRRERRWAGGSVVAATAELHNISYTDTLLQCFSATLLHCYIVATKAHIYSM